MMGRIVILAAVRITQPASRPMSIATKSIIFTTVAAFAVGAAAWAQEPDKKAKTHTEIDPAKLPPVAAQKDVTFAKDIRPLFEAACFRCHGTEKQKAGLRLDSLKAVLKGSEDGKVVIPGDSAKSRLVIATSGLDAEFAMPPRRVRNLADLGGPGGRGPDHPDGQNPPDPKLLPPANVPPLPPGLPLPGAGRGHGPGGGPSKPLTAEQVSLVRAWIEQGAK